MRTTTIACLLALLCTNLAQAAKEAEIRLNPNFYDAASKSLYVDVEIFYDGHGSLNLADQNYRMYFDSENLKLDASESFTDLPSDKYSDLEFKEIFEGVNVTGIDQLEFDSDLGFMNFAIDLIDSEDGGLELTRNDGWQRVAILKFDVTDASALTKIVWSRMGTTDDYATAFVEISEWVAPNSVTPVNIVTYDDLEFNSEADAEVNVTIKVGPNPAHEFVNIEVDNGLSQNATIIVKDMSGKTIDKHQMTTGSLSKTIVVDGYVDGTYHIEMLGRDKMERLYSDKIIINH